MYICFDLDDTLLHTDKSISEYTIYILKECRKRGHKLIANTARSLEYARCILDIIKPDYSILYAGALIVDENYNVIYKDSISAEITDAIIKRLKKEGYNFSIQILGNTLSSSPDIYGELTDFNEGYFGESLKIIPKNLDLLLGKEMASEYNVDYVTYRYNIWSRFSSINVSKLNGLKVVMEKENDSLENVISFGDDVGDLCMILGSGIGVVMEDAPDEVRSKVNNIAPSCNEDGVAKFLADYFEIK